MLARRFALAIGLMLAVVTSQVPEFVQQYRQRLGGAVDELKRIVAQFDEEARGQSLSREQGIDRLKINPDALARGRGADLEDVVDRERRLETQERGFAEAGPISQYWVFLERLDAKLARQAYAIYQPAVPVTPAGLTAAAVGLVLGWGGTRMVGVPFRRRRRAAVA
jgi:hypothetical protein